MFTRKRVVSALVAASFLMVAPSVQAKEEQGARGSTSETIVKAKPEVVFHGIIKLREVNKNTVKELSREGEHSCLLEETFDKLPIIGDAKCVYKEVYVPYRKIEYYLVRSDKFRAFEGKWELKPMEDGESTHVTLTSYVDVDVAVPFVRQLTKMQTMRGVKKRLVDLKETCETKSVSMSSTSAAH